MNRNILAVVLLILSFLGVYFFVPNEKGETVVENFWMLPNRTIKVDTEVMPRKGDFYSIPGTYQAMLSPRFSNVDYGANVRYNMPSNEYQAAPCDPLTFGKMAENYRRPLKEGFCGCQANGNNSGCGSVSCRRGGLGLDRGTMQNTTVGVGANATNLNAMSVSPQYNALFEKVKYPEASDMLPVGDMMSANALGDVQQPIIYDRFMYANQRSRLYGRGDPIRGDLACVPHAPEWFRPSVHPSIDLRAGALSTIAGVDNNSAQDLWRLQSATTLGAIQPPGVTMTEQKMTGLTGSKGDIQITSFP